MIRKSCKNCEGCCLYKYTQKDCSKDCNYWGQKND